MMAICTFTAKIVADVNSADSVYVTLTEVGSLLASGNFGAELILPTAGDVEPTIFIFERDEDGTTTD